MSIKINGTDVIDDNKRGIFLKLNPGVYTTSARDALSASAGDTIYNSDDEEIQVWTGTEWKSAGGTPPAPSINNVVLSEDVDDADRFKAKGFTANVTMDPESNPVSQKSIKAVITGSFPVYKESGAISNVSTNTSVTQTFNALVDTNYYATDDGDDKNSRIIACPTTKGAGNGAGYYVWTQFKDDDASTNSIYYGRKRLWWTPDLSATKTLIRQANPGYFTASDDHYYESPVLRIQILGDIVWCECGETGGYSQPRSSGDMLAWEDATGDNILNLGSTDLRSFIVTACDGEVVYYAQEIWNSSEIPQNIALRFRYRTAGGGWSTTVITNPFNGSYREGRTSLVYHKPSNRLVLYYVTSSGSAPFGRVLTYSIDNTKTDSSRLTLISTVSQAIADQPSGSVIHQATYCGDDGSYLSVLFSGSNQLYKYNSTTSNFSLITKPTFTNGSDARVYISGRGDGTIYATGNEFDSGSTSESWQVFRSTNQGTSWTQIRNVTGLGQPSQFAGSDALPLSITHSNEYLQGGYNQISSNARNSTRLVGFRDFLQTVTVPSPGNFANGDTVAKKGDQDNPIFIGKVANKSGSTFQVLSNETYSNGDELLNLSDFTQTSTTRYLKLNTAGIVSGMQQGDPGFVSVGTTTGIGITFPAILSSGYNADDEIPVGAGLSVTVQAVETTSGAASTFVSNTVFPS